MIEIKISGNTAEEVKSKVVSLFNQLTVATEAYEQTKQVAPKKATLKEKAPAKETKPAKAEPVVDTVSIEVPAEPEKQEEPAPPAPPAPQEQKTEDAKAYTVGEVRAAAKEFLLADPKERKPLLTAFLHDELKVKDITTMDPSLYGRVMDFVKSHE